MRQHDVAKWAHLRARLRASHAAEQFMGINALSSFVMVNGALRR
jgi:hypothetical protein